MRPLPSILLVDDDITTNFLNVKLLRYIDANVQVTTALNGQEALDALRTHCQPPTPRCPALIFLDINMPVLDGFGFLEAYQHQPQPGVVIVMLTTSVHPRDLTRLQGLPVAGFIAKPLSEAKVAQVLADHFPPGPAAH